MLPEAQTRAAPPAAAPASAPAAAPGARRLVAVIAIAVTASWWFTEGRWIESTDNAYVQGDIAVLGPRIEGDVAAIDVADNQRVHAGDPLIRLDPADWQARLAQAVPRPPRPTAAVLTAQRQIAQQQATIEAAQAAIAQAQAEQTRAGADAARSAKLTANGWASHQANDLAIADARKADGGAGLCPGAEIRGGTAAWRCSRRR